MPEQPVTPLSVDSAATTRRACALAEIGHVAKVFAAANEPSSSAVWVLRTLAQKPEFKGAVKPDEIPALYQKIRDAAKNGGRGNGKRR
jgi:hypothetical protein